jgi:hypothetical protein
VAYADRQTESFRLMTSLPSSGIKRWNIEDNDLLGKMDQVFGLMPGATISGTTTDNIYFMMKFGKALLDPIFYLLPVATIAGGGHHSLLEVVYPLSLNNLIDHKIGMYSTMLPKRGAKGEVKDSPGARQITRLLGNYENHGWNNYFMAYYDGGAGTPSGCIEYDKDEWQRFSSADQKLLDLFKTMPPWPTKKKVKGIPGKLAFGS